MKVKLEKVYNTKFFYATFVIDLDYLFNSIVELRKNSSLVIHPVNDAVAEIFDAVRNGAPIEFDLANCRLTPDCVRCIMKGMVNGIAFCDTLDVGRDSILAEDMKRLKIDKSSHVPLPEFVIGTSVKDYVKSLDNTVTYSIPLSDRNIYFPLAFIIQVCRPKINLAPGGLTNDFLKFIGSHLTIGNLENFDEFFYCTNEGVRVVKLNENRQLYDQKLRLATLEEALNIGVLVPAVFGSVNALQIPGFDLLFDQCLASLQALGANKKLTLEQFFG